MHVKHSVHRVGVNIDVGCAMSGWTPRLRLNAPRANRPEEKSLKRAVMMSVTEMGKSIWGILVIHLMCTSPRVTKFHTHLS